MSTTATTNNAASLFGSVIYSYTRAQAIEDGVLVSLDDATDSSGRKLSPFKYPVAMTRGAYEATVAVGGRWVPEPDGTEVLILPGGQDVAGRLHDVFWLMQLAIRQARAGEDCIWFSVLVDQHGNGRKSKVDLWCRVGPGDQGEPVMTIMLTSED